MSSTSSVCVVVDIMMLVRGGGVNPSAPPTRNNMHMNAIGNE